jgi:hypothetical protein
MNGTKGMLLESGSDKHGLYVALPFGAASWLRAATDRGPWWKVQMAVVQQRAAVLQYRSPPVVLPNAGTPPAWTRRSGVRRPVIEEPPALDSHSGATAREPSPRCGGMATPAHNATTIHSTSGHRRGPSPQRASPATAQPLVETRALAFCSKEL